MRKATSNEWSTVLEGANPSAEGEDADEGGDEAAGEPVLDLADQFRYAKMEGVSKKVYQADLKSMWPKQAEAGATDTMQNT